MNLQLFLDFCQNLLSKLFFRQKPFMKYREIRLIEELLINIKPKRVLEFGSGYSTFYFNDFLSKNNIHTRWLSIESDEAWFSYVIDKKSDNASILYEPNLDKYAYYPAKLKNSYDVVLVDGRVRKKCIVESFNYLSENGVLILHDANRSYYYPKDLSMFGDQVLFLDNRKNERMGDGGILLLAKNKGTIAKYLNIEKHQLEWANLESEDLYWLNNS